MKRILLILLAISFVGCTSTSNPVAKRPQDPTTFPYKQEEVTFTNPKGGSKLAGTLTIPSTGKVSKVVILITGGGPQDRNSEVKEINHRPFLIWSDWLTRNGIAVLRYDDRGVGKSTGDFATATTNDFAEDTEAAVKYLLSRKDLSKLSIGLMGHSEGGMIAAMVASRNKGVKFICLLATPGIPTREVMLQQAKDSMRLRGASSEDLKLMMALMHEVIQTTYDNEKLGSAEFKVKLDSVLYKHVRNFPPSLLYGKTVEEYVKLSSPKLVSPGTRQFATFNPAEYLTKVKCPVLALNGTLDSQVESAANLSGIKAALQLGGNSNHEGVALNGLNHLFQQAKTGALTEYAQISETVNPLALEKVSTWINHLKE